MHTLKIEHLFVQVDDKQILKDFSLTMHSGEIHALMGPNGVGKSTLTKVIMGDDNYKIMSGEIYYDDILLNTMPVDERSRLGIFLGMQMPPEIEGVTNADFLRTALHTREKEDFNLFSFIKKIDATVEELQMDKQMVHRGINCGFSGGERKKNEILQMLLLHPSCIMLDEIDSGLDVDSLKLVGTEVSNYFKEEKPLIFLVTHYKRLLDYIKPTHVHILYDGHIVKTGGYELVDEIEKNGYNLKNDTSVVRGKEENE